MKRKTITGLLFLGCSVGCVLLFIHVTTQPEPMHLTNPESRETALWNVRVQVRATGPSADRSGWETVHKDYPAGPGPAHIEPAKSSEFQVNSPGQTTRFSPTVPQEVLTRLSEKARNAILTHE